MQIKSDIYKGDDVLFVDGMHLNITPGDFVYKDWQDGDWMRFRRKTMSLRLRGYRLTNKEYASNGDYFENFKQIGTKKLLIVTYMCS